MKKYIIIRVMINYLIILAFIVFDTSKTFMFGAVTGLALVDFWYFMKEL